MKTPVVSYRTKWPTGWKSEWFYVKIDEEKEKLVQSPLKLTFGLTRPQCNMTPGDPCQDAVYEFRIVSEHIGSRDLVQEYLANKVFPTSSALGTLCWLDIPGLSPGISSQQSVPNAEEVGYAEA